MKILYLEDVHHQATSVSELFRENGHEVVWCDTFDRATEVMKDDEFDVIVSDYDLGDLHGRTGLTFLQGQQGRRILFSGISRIVPDDITFVLKSNLLELIEEVERQPV